jgi:hypothetical protein
MEVRALGRSVWKKDVSPGSVFIYRVDVEPALGILLKRNADGFAAVALTHAPGKQKTLPSLVSDEFFKPDQTVFVYDEAYILADQKFANLNCANPEVGSVVSSVSGALLRCHRDGTDYEVDLTTGELKKPGHTPIFWTSRWAIKDRFGNLIFEQ